MRSALNQPLAVTAYGALSPIGANAVQSAAAIRAGLAGFTEHEYYDSVTKDPGWDEEIPLLAASVPGVDPHLDGTERLVALAVPALIEALADAKLKRTDIDRAALLCALPASDQAVDGWDLDARLVPELCKTTGLTAFTRTVTARSGHTGVFELLPEAAALLQQGEARYCLLLGLDTYLSEDRMELLDGGWRLRSERNVDGFLPGEAACCLVLELPEEARARDVAPHAIVHGGAFGVEPQASSSDRQSTGTGLAHALMPFAEGATWVGCDLNGESYRAFEWGLVLARLAPHLEGLRVLTHPADCIGDVGAAIGAILIAYVSESFRGGWAPAPTGVLWTAADGEARAAVRMGSE